MHNGDGERKKKKKMMLFLPPCGASRGILAGVLPELSQRQFSQFHVSLTKTANQAVHHV